MLGAGEGASRRIAETQAAAEALETIRRERLAARAARQGLDPADMTAADDATAGVNPATRPATEPALEPAPDDPA
ncbi:MAG TPA: hypothetical protein VF770_05545 [Solirubrobacterales bacterium]